MFRQLRLWVVRVLATLGLAVLLVVATPVADYLALPLRDEGQLRSAEAIVVLGGGAYRAGGEDGCSDERSAFISSATAETLGAEMALQAWRNAAISWRLWCPARLLKGGHRRSYGPEGV